MKQFIYWFKAKLDRIFEVSIILKAIDAAGELIAGILLLTISPHFIDRLTTALTQHELSEDPHDFFANLIAHAGHNLAHNAKLFTAIYLIVHGVVKLVVIIEVMRQKLWAYPALIVVLFGFIGYQTDSLIHRITGGMLFLTIFDLFIVVLTWLEWQKHRRRHQSETAHHAKKIDEDVVD